MKRIGRIVLRSLVITVVITLVIFGIRTVNGWRYPSDAGPDLQNAASYDLVQEGVRIEHVTGERLNGFHLLPAEVSHPGVVVTFGGSEGNPDFDRAVSIAQQGYEVYALFFFGQENQSEALAEVPLEMFDELLARVEQSSAVPGPLTVIGSSKGAELALLLGAQEEQIDNVVLFAPTMHFFQGLGIRAPAGPPSPATARTSRTCPSATPPSAPSDPRSWPR